METGFISRRRFEALCIAGAVIETIFLGLIFDRRLAVDGIWLAILFTFVFPWVPCLLGFAVTRRRSRAAALLFLLLVGLAWVAGIRAGTSTWWDDPVLFVGALATLVQTIAALMLVSPAGWRWTATSSTANTGTLP
ncbi:MAG: hypothetical protein ACK4PC_05325 [Sphingopyxis sp.]